MLHLRIEPTWQTAHILVNHFCITEIILVLILDPGQLHNLFSEQRRVSMQGIIATNFCNFNKLNNIYHMGFKPRYQHSPYSTNFQFNQHDLMVEDIISLSNFHKYYYSIQVIIQHL